MTGQHNSTATLPPLTWRPDCWGNAGRGLYLGRINVGSVDHHPTFEPKASTPWRVWVHTSSDGDGFGWFATEDEAKARLVAVVTEMLAT